MLILNRHGQSEPGNIKATVKHTEDEADEKSPVRKEIRVALDFVNRLVGGQSRWKDLEITAEVSSAAIRPYASGQRIVLGTHHRRGTAAHEIGHVLETADFALHTRAVQFLRYRTRGAGLGPVPHGERHEVALQSINGPRWFNIYCGKVYDSRAVFDREEGRYTTEPNVYSPIVQRGAGERGIHATEIVSMGIEQLMNGTEDLDSLLSFMNDDPEYFDFIIGVLLGEF